MQSPDGFHRQGFAIEDDLATLFILPIPEITSNVHPPDCFFVGSLVSLADDEIDVDRLTDPIFQVAVVFYVEDFPSVASACPQVGIAALELHVDFHPARLAIIVLEFYLAIDAVVEHAHWAEYLVRLSANRHHVADQDLLQRLRIESLRSCFFHGQDLLRHRVALQALLDEVDQLYFLIALLSYDERLARRKPLMDQLVIQYGFATRAHIPPVAPYVAAESG